MKLPQTDYKIVPEPLNQLSDYGLIPIKFEVRSVLELDAASLDGFRLQERRLAEPWIKDYDSEGNRPQDWAKSFDLTNWGRLGAFAGERRVASALIAHATPELHMLEDRPDLAVLWDIRTEPELRGQGVGTALFAACEQWAKAQGCRWLKVETQNINVPACRFYQRMGCELGAIHRFAYADFPQEVQLLWYKKLS